MAVSNSSTVLKQIFAAARPLVEAWLDAAEQIAALRETATNAGLDWSQIKSLVKAQVQDERDGAGDGKRIRRLIERAEFASAYADMLGLGKMNENNFSAPAHDLETGELTDTTGDDADPPPAVASEAGAVDYDPALASTDIPPDIPDFLRRGTA